LAALRLCEAEALFAAGLYDGSAYLCGYVVELALKARICRLLDVNKYPDSGKFRQAYVWGGDSEGDAVAVEQSGRLKALHRLPCAESRSPGPLKIESAQMPGYVDDLADEEQAGDFKALHRLGR